MNENLDLTKILKDCPKGIKLYSTIHGEIEFDHIDETIIYPIVLRVNNNIYHSVTKDGKSLIESKGECVLFPSKEQRDWSKFTAPWIKKERFDPKTLKPFDRVLVRNSKIEKWRCNHFSYFNEGNECPYVTFISYKFCVPYNDDTKHLVGTDHEAPEYYRYWED